MLYLDYVPVLIFVWDSALSFLLIGIFFIFYHVRGESMYVLNFGFVAFLSVCDDWGIVYFSFFSFVVGL